MTAREPTPTLPGVEAEPSETAFLPVAADAQNLGPALLAAAGGYLNLAIGAAEDALDADEPAAELAYLAAGAAALSAAAAAYTAAVHAVPADEGGR